MELDSIGEDIAERVVMRSVNGGEPQEVTVRVGRPQQFPDGNGWFCPWELIGIGDPKIKYAAGFDAFQSLQLVLCMISSNLHYWKRGPNVTMFFLEAGDDLGFP